MPDLVWSPVAWMHAVVRCLTRRNPLLLSRHQHHQPSASDWIGEAERGCAQRRTAPHPASAAPSQLYASKPVFKYGRESLLLSGSTFSSLEEPLNSTPFSCWRGTIVSPSCQRSAKRGELLRDGGKSKWATRSHASHWCKLWSKVDFFSAEDKLRALPITRGVIKLSCNRTAVSIGPAAK